MATMGTGARNYADFTQLTMKHWDLYVIYDSSVG